MNPSFNPATTDAVCLDTGTGGCDTVRRRALLDYSTAGFLIKRDPSYVSGSNFDFFPRNLMTIDTFLTNCLLKNCQTECFGNQVISVERRRYHLFTTNAKFNDQDREVHLYRKMLVIGNT